MSEHSSRLDKCMSNYLRLLSTSKLCQEDTQEESGLSTTSSEFLDETEVLVDFATNNIVDLPVKSESRVVAYLKHLFLEKQFSSWAGQALISIHPYTHPNNNKIDDKKGVANVHTLVSKVWFKLVNKIGRRNQTIIISGDSGSGKTYSACLALKCIAQKQEESKNKAYEHVLWQVLYSIPILTAFGNAVTIHNNNSSRFGKLLQLQYNNGNIVGAFIETYMLEKSRVSGQNSNEGNFHIFRQILDNTSEKTLNKLLLSKQTHYKIAPKVFDVTDDAYIETLNAFEMLELKETTEVMMILSIILNLGNVEFHLRKDSFVATPETSSFLQNAAVLLQTDPTNLVNLLTVNVVTAKTHGKNRNTFYNAPFTNIEDCEDRRNCFIRFLYEKLFLFIVRHINKRICAKGIFNLLGILDVYGFEVFHHNTFEQLCINYANERLQQYFVKDYLLKQQNDLTREKFDTDSIDTKEYDDRLKLLDGTISVFSILNEECAMNRFNSDIFVNSRLTATLKESSYFVASPSNLTSNFAIKHYAGTVKYDTRSMIMKNKDKVPEDMLELLRVCKMKFVKKIIDFDLNLIGDIKKKTLLIKFKNSLDSLMKILDNGDVHFIKCLKPNAYQISNFFDTEFFVNQIRANGILEILKLSFQNYSIKLTFDDFRKRFQHFLLQILPNALESEMHVGTTLVYLTEKGFRACTFLTSLNRTAAARKIQRLWRKYFGRRQNAARKIQKFYRDILLRKQMSCIDQFIDLSKKESCYSIPLTADKYSLRNLSYVSSYKKAEDYVKSLGKHGPMEGDPISLSLEKLFNSLETKKFKRMFFFGDHIVSRIRPAEVPVRLHLKKSCMPYSNVLPKSEIPQGLSDILQPYDHIKKYFFQR